MTDLLATALIQKSFSTRRSRELDGIEGIEDKHIEARRTIEQLWQGRKRTDGSWKGGKQTEPK